MPKINLHQRHNQLFKMNQNNQNNQDNLTITLTMSETHYCLICLSPYNFNKSTNHDPTTPSEWMSDCVGEDLLFSRFNFLSNMNAILKKILNLYFINLYISYQSIYQQVIDIPSSASYGITNISMFLIPSRL